MKKLIPLVLVALAILATSALACPRTRTVIRGGSAVTVQSAPAPVVSIAPALTIQQPQPTVTLQPPSQQQQVIQVAPTVRVRPGILPFFFGQRTVIVSP